MKRSVEQLANQQYDVLVIGGGIHGAAIAREAACRGLKTALVEKSDFTGGTSANSLKILHGGLRYLPHMEIRRTFEAIREQESWLRCAPHLAAPQRFLSPTYDNRLSRSRPFMSLAMLANNILTRNCRRIPDASRQLPAGEVIGADAFKALVPQVDSHHINGAISWSDICLYDSERLVMGMLKDAVSEGAVVANYVCVEELLKDDHERIIGGKAVDISSGSTFAIRARMTIQSTGAWTDHLLRRGAVSSSPNRMGLAMNLLVRNFSVSQNALGLYSPVVNRHLFFVPWRGVTMAGTWYRNYDFTSGRLTVSDEDIDKGLKALNACFPEPVIQLDDVIGVHAGLLPAVNHGGNGEEPTFRRNYRILDHARIHGMHGLITALGIKYSTARSVAAKTISLANQYLQNAIGDTTLHRPVVGGDISDFVTLRGKTLAACPHVAPAVVEHLFRLFGTEIQTVICDAGGLAATEVDLWDAVARFCIRDEMPASLGDLVFRRSGLASAGELNHDLLLRFAETMGLEQNWSQRRIRHEIEQVTKVRNLWMAGTAFHPDG